MTVNSLSDIIFHNCCNVSLKFQVNDVEMFEGSIKIHSYTPKETNAQARAQTHTHTRTQHTHTPTHKQQTK